MILRRVNREALAKEPHLAWNAFVNLLAMEEYGDLSPVQCVAHLCFWYDSEVQNGGHLQYFENHGTHLLQPTLDALAALGAHDQRGLLTRAGDVWLSRPRPQIDTVEEYVAVALQGEFNEYDEAYYRYVPTITELLERYLESHKEHFLEEV